MEQRGAQVRLRKMPSTIAVLYLVKEWTGEPAAHREMHWIAIAQQLQRFEPEVSQV